MRTIKLLIVASVTASTMWIAGPAAAEECNPDDGRLCCETTADPVNRISRRLVGQDVLLCTQ